MPCLKSEVSLNSGIPFAFSVSFRRMLYVTGSPMLHRWACMRHSIILVGTSLSRLIIFCMGVQVAAAWRYVLLVVGASVVPAFVFSSDFFSLMDISLLV